MSQSNPWLLQTTPNVTMSGVAFGNGIYVAVGPNGAVMTSLNGFSWTTQVSGNAGNYRSVNYGNGIFVACDQNASTNGFMTSPDGINWTTRAIPLANEVYDVAFANGVWIACVIRASAIAILRSTNNAVTWTNISTPVGGPGNNNWTGIAYGNGVWVSVSNRSPASNNIMTSSDNGLTWVLQTKPSTQPVWAVNFGNGKFIASSGTVAEYYISTDGISWTLYSFPVNRLVRSLVYANGVWTAVGIDNVSTNSAFYSTNEGLSFTAITTTVGPWSYVCFGNGKFVAVRNVLTTNAIMTWTGLSNASILYNIL